MGGAVFELSYFFRQATGKGEQAGKRQVLAKRNEMDLVVSRCPLAAWADECCGVENRAFDIGLTGIASDSSNYDPCIRITGELTDLIAKANFIGKEWRRRFGPDDEIDFVVLRGIHCQLRQVA